MVAERRSALAGLLLSLALALPVRGAVVFETEWSSSQIDDTRAVRGLVDRHEGVNYRVSQQPAPLLALRTGGQFQMPKTLGGYPTAENDIMPGRGDTAQPTEFGSILRAFTRERRQERVISNWSHKSYLVPGYDDGGVIGSKIALFGCPADQPQVKIEFRLMGEAEKVVAGGTGEAPSQKAAALVRVLSGPQAEATREARLESWWRDAKFGMFIHWGPASLSGAEISWGMMDRIEGGAQHQRVERDTYMNLYRQFNPVHFDADEWMRLAQDAGMKYVVFVTKHHDGFSLWPTRQARFAENAGLPPHYSIADTLYQRDLCRMIADAAHRHGLKLGWYYSTRDWTHPEYLQGDNGSYNRYYQAQVRELLSNYGQIDMMWFDHCFGDWSQYTLVDLFQEMYRLQPDLLINDRAARGLKNIPAGGATQLVRGDYDTPEQRIGTFQRGRAWESCVTMTYCSDGGGWSYRPDGRIRTLQECIRMLVSTVTGDGNLLLNIGPMPTGEFQPQEIANLKGMGRWLRQFGESIYGTRGGPYHNGEWGGSCYKGRVLYLHVFQWAGATLRLPPLKARVLQAGVLGGGPIDVEQSDAGLTLVLPADRRDETDTVIRLELDSPAEEEFINGKPLGVSPPLRN